MSSYTFYGDDQPLDGLWSGIKKVVKHSPIGQGIKFIAHPIKESKAAIKTIARFDPTAKTAKYGNITKGVLAGAALATAAVLTGGTALAVAGGVGSALGTGIGIGAKPVRKPVKRITPSVVDQLKNLAPSSMGLSTGASSFTDSQTPSPVADASPIDAYTTGEPKKVNTTQSFVVIGICVAALAAIAVKASKKKPTLQGV